MLVTTMAWLMATFRNKRWAYVAGAVAGGAAVAGVAVAASGTAGATHTAVGTRAVTVGTTFTVPGTSEQFAPPPPDAAPALTADQAWADFAGANGWGTTITPDMTVRFGSFTDPIGPYCGAECDVWQTVNGISYRALHELAYGYYWSTCPSGSALPAVECQNWFFVDANTGKMIIGALPRHGAAGSTLPEPTPSSSA